MTEKNKDRVHTEWYDNGKKKTERKHKDGIDGLFDWIETTWFENGQKKSENIIENNYFKKSTYWYENGQKESEGIYHHDPLRHNGMIGDFLTINRWDRNGKILVKDGNGKVIDFYDDGQKKHEKIWTDTYLWKEIFWYENGRKKNVIIREYSQYINFDMIHYLITRSTSWYENGQKENEIIYENHRTISKREWNEDGSMKE